MVPNLTSGCVKLLNDSGCAVKPASSRSFPVTGAVHVVWKRPLDSVIRILEASGVLVGVSVKWHWHRCTTSAERENLCFALACHVRRRSSLLFVSSYTDGRVKSGVNAWGF